MKDTVLPVFFKATTLITGVQLTTRVTYYNRPKQKRCEPLEVGLRNNTYIPAPGTAANIHKLGVQNITGMASIEA